MPLLISWLLQYNFYCVVSISLVYQHAVFTLLTDFTVQHYSYNLF